MGYYTYYTLEIVEDPDNQKDEFYEHFEEETMYSSKEFKDYGEMEATWQDWEEDMIELSKRFPKMLFKLEGDGEEQFDVWNCYFCNGKSHYREIQTYWEPFDEKGFYKHNKS